MKGLAMIMVCGVALAGGAAPAASDYEGRAYRVLEQQGKLELREYDASLAVSVPMENSNGAFRELFRFISGENEENRKIAMTVPVQQADSAAGWSVAFMLPSQYTLDDAPVPTDPRVRVRQVPGRLMAVIRYSGRWTEKNFAAKSEVLRKVMQEESVAPLGEVHSALYNAPYTPPFMRRNEVMVEANRLPAQAVKRLEEHQLASY